MSLKQCRFPSSSFFFEIKKKSVIYIYIYIFLGFAVTLSESIRSHKLSNPCHQSETINSIVSILETLIQWIDKIPPTQQSFRYNNPLATATSRTRPSLAASLKPAIHWCSTSSRPISNPPWSRSSLTSPIASRTQAKSITIPATRPTLRHGCIAWLDWESSRRRITMPW